MLGNAAVAVGLALLALAVGYAVRSPAVRHAAWVLVLLKFVTPPLFTLPLPVLPASWGEQASAPAASGDLIIIPGVTEAGPRAPAWWEAYRPAGVADWLLVG